MSTALTPVTLASGSASLTASGVGSALYRQEEALPEGSRMQLTLTVRPVAGQDVAGVVAAAFNAAVRAGHALGAAPPPTPWPGATDWATGANGQVVIRWVKEQPQILVVIGILALIVVAGILVLGLITHWTFLHWITPRPSPGAGISPLTLALVGLVVFGGVALVEHWTRSP